MIINFFGKMGRGKTLSSVITAIRLFKKHRNLKTLIANFKIDAERLRVIIGRNIEVLNTFGFFPLGRVNNAVVIYDDILRYRQYVKNIMSVIVNASRKSNLHIITTFQYFFSGQTLQLRLMGTNISPFFYNGLLFGQRALRFKYPKIEFSRPFILCRRPKPYMSLYNTYEIVKYLTKIDILKESLKFCKTNEDKKEVICAIFGEKVYYKILRKMNLSELNQENVGELIKFV